MAAASSAMLTPDQLRSHARFGAPLSSEALYALADQLETAERRLRELEGAAEKSIRCKWVPEKEFGYGKAMRVTQSDHPRFVVGSRFDYGFLNVAVEQGYSVHIDPVPDEILSAEGSAK